MMQIVNRFDCAVSTKEYFEQLIQAFPNFNKDITSENKINQKMEYFADYTVDQIKLSNWDKLIECFDFQEKRITSVCPNLRDAIKFTYCEALLFYETNSANNKMIEYMGPLLSSYYKEYKEYYNNLVKEVKQFNN